MSTAVLNCGNTFSADATTFSAMTVSVSLPPAASAFFAVRFRSCSRPVMSAWSCCVTCGTVAQAC